ncbi:MAG: hypothetical protein GWP91_14530 [Rhodobacterales bacterium]|nr:hypothetical protein [Rhodobacterales bacterium]
MDPAAILALVIDALSWAFLMGGAFFCVVSAVGMLRMPDFYTRCHAAGLGDTMGVALIFIGLGLQADGDLMVLIKLAFTWAFIWITGPIATHALVKAAYARGFAIEDNTPTAGAAHAD